MCIYVLWRQHPLLPIAVYFRIVASEETKQTMFGNVSEGNNALCPAFGDASPRPTRNNWMLHILAKDGRSVFGGLFAVVLATIIVSRSPLDDTVQGTGPKG